MALIFIEHSTVELGKRTKYFSSLNHFSSYSYSVQGGLNFYSYSVLVLKIFFILVLVRSELKLKILVLILVLVH